VGNPDAAREHPLVGLARGDARGAWLLRETGDRRPAAWSWGKQVIAGIYARIFVVFCCLVALATSASAEGMILWVDEYRGGELELRPLRPLTGSLTYGDCDREKTARVREFASKYRADYKVEAGGGMVLLTGYRPTGELTAIMVYRFVCLPDTVDPRGPKGK